MTEPFMDWPLVEGDIGAWREWKEMQEERLMTSMGAYLPPESGEAGAVYALLNVIAHPDEAKKALDKMVAERKAIENATEKQQKIIHDADAANRKQHAEAEKLRAEAERAQSKAAADLGAAKNTLQQAERYKEQAQHAERAAAAERADLEDREEKIEARAKEMAGEIRELQRRETACENREEKLRAREADLDAREKRLQADIDENMKWLAGLKPPRGR